MRKESRIYVAGHKGLVGSAICRTLKNQGYHQVISKTSQELDLRNESATRKFFDEERPEFVFLAAAKVGGIHANNTRRGEFIFDNLAIQGNAIDAAYRSGVQKMVFLGSSCIYPKACPQPIREDYLLTGPLEPTNEPYAIAKIAGLKMCEAYRSQYGFNAISLMPTNLYGPGDNFDLLNSHVLPALIRKVHEAKSSGASEVVVWGSGTPRREFLYVSDLANAAVFLMTSYDGSEPVNVGVGSDVTIAELVEIIRSVVSFTGDVVYDRSKPDGTPRKLLDVSRLSSLGWVAETPLEVGIERTYRWFLENQPHA